MKNLFIALMLLTATFTFAQEVVKHKKAPSKRICLHKGENIGCGETRTEAKHALALAIKMDAKMKVDSIAKLEKK